MSHKESKVKDGVHSETYASDSSTAVVDQHDDETDDDDELVRFQIATGGRRMGIAEFIDHIRHMDSKRRWITQAQDSGE